MCIKSGVGQTGRGIFPFMGGGITIEFEGLAKRFDMRVVFRSVSGRVEPGEVLTVTGPNGSGKSTLVTILCGLVRATRGTVRYRASSGKEISRESWRDHLGIVAPAMNLYEELDAMENLRFFALVRGLREAEARCRTCLKRVGLDPDRKTPVRGFSTGMHQRLKIGQAILHEPEVLFLDEPGANLDPAGQDWLEGLVTAERQASTTIVLATNDLREMEWGTSRVALSG